MMDTTDTGNNDTSKLSDRKRELLMLRLKKSALAQSAQPALQTIPPCDRGAPIPLSWPQQRLWFLDQLDHTAGAAYHIPAGLRLQGRLDRAALKATLDRIVARHEALRTSFTGVGGDAVQTIAPADSGFPLAEHDLSALRGHERELALARHGDDEVSNPFDLAVGPMIRGRLLRLAEDEHVLLVTQHHINSDGWSLGLMVREISALYTAFSQGRPDPLPALGIQYADYAVWQRERLRGDLLQTKVDFWKTTLTGAPTLLELPLDRPRPQTQSYAGAHLELELPPALTAGLRAFSQRHGATLFMTLLTGWALLMSRLSGQLDVVIGTPVANRQLREIEGLMGFFVNTLALRVRLEDDPTVEELLARVKADTLAAYGHQDLPFEQVVAALNPPRSMGHSPVFQVMLTMSNAPNAGDFQLPGLILSAVEHAHVSAQFDLSLALTDNGATIGGRLAYASALFDGASSARLARQFQTVLGAMLAEPLRPASQVDLLDGAERHQLLHAFQGASVAYPKDKLIHQLFEEQATARPLATALLFEGLSLSYAELNQGANQVARRLIGLGVGPDQRVGVCLERGFNMVIALLGVLKAGAAYVPLDPGYPAERLAYMLRDSAPVALLTEAALLARLPLAALTPAPAMLVLDAPQELALLAALPHENPDARALGLRADHLAYVIYTSGSTGQPKGVMNQHDGVVNRLLWAQDEYRLRHDDRVLQKTPFSFDVSVWEFFLPLLAGAQLVIAKPRGHQDPRYLAQLIEAAGVTMAHFVPSMLRVFLDQATAASCRPLRRVLCSGEALPLALQDRFLATLPAVELHNLYGPTEAAVDVTYWRCAAGSARDFVPIGRAIANIRMYILDRHLRPQPIGVAGEIHIGGIGVARGYLNQPQLTQQRFLPDPFGADGERLYKTGDLGRWMADGNIEYLGRNDFQVKIRGLRIELGEIEVRLAACAGVRACVVIAREDTPGDQRLVAYLVAQDGAAPAAEDLRRQLAVHLADYMLPAAFVTLDALPLTPNGKLDRAALPAPDMAAARRQYQAPRGAAESAIAAIWEELLGLERAGRDDNFFELGGHSLLATQVVARLREQFSIDVPLINVFQHPTIGALAAQLFLLDLGRFDSADVASAFEDLDDLSDEEVEALLAEELLAQQQTGVV